MGGFWKDFSQKPVGSARFWGEGGIGRNKDNLDLRPEHLQGQEGQAWGSPLVQDSHQGSPRAEGCGAWCGPPTGLALMGPVSLGCTQASTLGKALSFLSLRPAVPLGWDGAWVGGFANSKLCWGSWGRNSEIHWGPPFGDIEGSWFADQEAEAQSS